MAGTHPRPTEGECALALLLCDVPLTVNCVTAHPCPALLCAIHSYGPSSSADAFGISHDAMAEYLKQRHVWFIGQHIFLLFMSHPVALWHIHALEIIFIKSQLHFMKVIQARESTPRQNSCFVKLSMWCLENQLCIYPLVDRWTNKMQEWGSTNALQACPLVRLGSDLINAFKWGNRRAKLRGSEGIGRKASQMLWSAEQIEKRLTERTSRFPV